MTFCLWWSLRCSPGRSALWWLCSVAGEASHQPWICPPEYQVKQKASIFKQQYCLGNKLGLYINLCVSYFFLRPMISETKRKYFQDEYFQRHNKGKLTLEGGKYSKWRPVCCGNNQSQLNAIFLLGKCFSFPLPNILNFLLLNKRAFWLNMEGCACTISCAGEYPGDHGEALPRGAWQPCCFFARLAKGCQSAYTWWKHWLTEIAAEVFLFLVVRVENC